MSFLANLKKPNSKNAIKEAVISLFLAAPIIKPKRFGQLINKSFSQSFQHFEPVNAIKFQFKNADGKITQLNQISDEVGFKFTRFVNGATSNILQGINEEQRTFISYHIFDYNRWKDFVEDFKHVITNLSEGQSNLFVTAFSLHYIDEFVWDNVNEPVPFREIFNTDSSFLPKEFFDSLTNEYHLTSQRRVGEFSYFDRLEVKINSNPGNSLIYISHNITQQIVDTQDLNELIQNDEFFKMLQQAHEYNKDLLKSVLKESIQSYIGLK